MYNYSFTNLRSFILPSLKRCRRLIAHNRTNNTYSRSNSINHWYYFCPSIALIFKKKEKYEKHSKSLVKALKKWIDYLTFPYCEYVGGSLQIYDYYSNTDEIPLLTQAKEHLEKSYPHILKIHDKYMIMLKMIVINYAKKLKNLLKQNINHHLNILLQLK